MDFKNKQFKMIIIACGFIILLLSSFLVYELFFTSDVEWKGTARLPLFYSKLNGVEAENEAEANSAAVAVMIDNFSTMRGGQYGLNSAFVVYEALAEGDVTRFFAVFPSYLPVEKVGPVRSARPYFVDLVQEYGAMYMHCGGSMEALERIKNESIFSANEFFNGNYYWRDKNISAPHNLFTSSELWNKFLEKNPAEKKDFKSWKFGDGLRMASTAKSISVVYYSDYSVSWKYDEILGRYLRFVNSEPHLDGDGVQISSDNVLLQYVRTNIIDDYGRREMVMSGEGEARMMRDGKIEYGVWKKESGRTVFYASNGEEWVLKRGKIWTQIVPSDTSVVITT